MKAGGVASVFGGLVGGNEWVNLGLVFLPLSRLLRSCTEGERMRTKKKKRRSRRRGRMKAEKEGKKRKGDFQRGKGRNTEEREWAREWEWRVGDKSCATQMSRILTIEIRYMNICFLFDYTAPPDFPSPFSFKPFLTSRPNFWNSNDITRTYIVVILSERWLIKSYMLFI